MALSSITVKGQGGLTLAVSAAVTGVTGGVIRYAHFDAPQWVKSTGATNNVTGVGFATKTALAAGGTQDYDLTAMTDPSGQAVTFASIKFVLVALTSTTGKLKVGGTGPSNINGLWFNDTSDASLVQQGGPPFFQGSATAVTVDGTHKNFRVTNTHSTETADYVVVVGGLI